MPTSRTTAARRADDRSERATEAEISDFIALHPQGLEWLRVFSQSTTDGRQASFASVAEQLDVSKRAISNALHDLNDAFYKLTGSYLLQTHARGFELTRQGQNLAAELQDRHRATTFAVAASVNHAEQFWLPVTTNCIPRFKELRGHLKRSKSRIHLEADGHRSADLLPGSLAQTKADFNPRKVAYGMYSACLDTSNLTRPLGHAQTPWPMEVIVLDVEPFELLVHKSVISDTSPVSLSQLWDQGGRLIVPEGGAALNFVDEVEPSWHRRRRFLRSTDLEGCLSTLEHLESEDGAMIVHGFAPSRLPQGFHTLTIKDMPHLKAVKGLYRRPDAESLLQPHQLFKWRQVWEGALAKWVGEGEGVS